MGWATAVEKDPCPNSAFRKVGVMPGQTRLKATSPKGTPHLFFKIVKEKHISRNRRVPTVQGVLEINPRARCSVEGFCLFFLQLLAM